MEKKPTGGKDVRWVSLSEASKGTPYSAEYLGLLARRNKLFARKIDGVWHTTKFALADYIKSQKEVRKELNKNLTPAFAGGSSSVTQAFEQWKEKDILARRRTSLEPKTFSNLTLHLGNISDELQEEKASIVKNHFTQSLAVMAVLVLMVVSSASYANRRLEAPGTGLEAASLFGVLSGVADFLASGFSNLRDLALGVETDHPVAGGRETGVESGLGGGVVAVKASQETTSLSFLRSDLKAELEAYIRSQISSAGLPVLVRETTPIYNTTVLREEILVSDTRPTITRQSNSDVNLFSRAIDSLLSGGEFNSPSIVGGSITDASASLTSLTVSATTTLNGLVLANDTFTSTAQSTFTKVPTLAHVFAPFWPNGTSNASDGTVYINPATSVADGNLLSAAVGGNVKFLVDAEGDIYGGNLILSGSTSQGATTIAGNLTVQDSAIFGDATSDLATFNSGLLALSSTTLQNFTFQNATGTNATTTNLHASSTLTGAGNFIVESSGKVGIGTMSPEVLLHVNNPTNHAYARIQSVASAILNLRNNNGSSGEATLAVAGGGGQVLNSAGGNDVIVGASTNANILFGNAQTGATEYARITGAGKMGIGTTSPWGKLSVTGSGVGTGIGFVFADSSNSPKVVVLDNGNLGVGGVAAPIWPIDAGAGTGRFGGIRIGNSNTEFGSLSYTQGSTNNLTITNNYETANELWGNIDFKTKNNALTAMTIRGTDGNVGIGTTTPATALQVVGNVQIGVTNQNGQAPLQVSQMPGAGGNIHIRPPGGQSAYVTFTENAVADKGAIGFDAGATSAGTALNFRVGSGHTLAPIRMSLASDGNVGIGTTTPWAKLSIGAHNQSSSAPLFVVASSSTGVATSTRFVVTGAGNIGIGTASTSEKLELFSLSNENQFMLFNGANNFRMGYLANSPHFRIQDDTNDRLVITNTSRVGINTADPGARLSLGAEVANSVLLVYDGGGSDTYGFGISANLLRMHSAGVNSDIGFFGGASGSEIMRIKGSGNIGIGTTTPQAVLHTVGQIRSSVADDTTAFRITETDGVTNAISLYRDTNNAFTMDVGSASRALVVTTSGNVGIGTTTPSALLHVYGTSDDKAIFSSTGAAGTSNILLMNGYGTGSSEGWRFQAMGDAPGDFNISRQDNGGAWAEYMRITKAGNVGIGTSTPLSKLEVYDGALKASGSHFLFNAAEGSSSDTADVMTVKSARGGGFTGAVFRADNSNGNIFYVQGTGRVGIGGAPVQTVDFEILAKDNSTGVGRTLFIGRNTNASTPAPGSLVLAMGNNSYRSVYVDDSGLLRILASEGVTSALNGTGTVVGDQSSWIAMKENIIEWNGEEALQAILDTELYDYQFVDDSYKTAQGNKPNYKGLVIDEAARENNAWFARNLGEGQIPSLNFPNLFGYLIASIQEIAEISGVFKNNLVAWLGDTANGIGDFFANRVHTKELCVGDESGETCITRSQLDALLVNAGSGSSSDSSEIGPVIVEINDTASTTEELTNEEEISVEAEEATEEVVEREVEENQGEPVAEAPVISTVVAETL